MTTIVQTRARDVFDNTAVEDLSDEGCEESRRVVSGVIEEAL